jgi:hypothetical protein
MLKAIHDLAAEALQATGHLLNDEQEYCQATVDIEPTGKKRKDEQIVPLTSIQPVGQNGSSFENSCGPT